MRSYWQVLVDLLLGFILCKAAGDRLEQTGAHWGWCSLALGRWGRSRLSRFELLTPVSS